MFLQRSVVALAILIAPIGAAHAQITTPCADSQMEEHVRHVILEGIDQGLRNQTARLFELWMKDQSNQPQRALTGMDAAVEAFMRSRDNVLKWNPHTCGDKP